MTQILPIFLFQVRKHYVAGVWDNTYDVVDTRTKPPTVMQNFANQPAAAADAVARNKVASGH